MFILRSKHTQWELTQKTHCTHLQACLGATYCFTYSLGCSPENPHRADTKVSAGLNFRAASIYVLKMPKDL